jgi:Flp pilus assembly protein TadD
MRAKHTIACLLCALWAAAAGCASGPGAGAQNHPQGFDPDKLQAMQQAQEKRRAQALPQPVTRKPAELEARGDQMARHGDWAAALFQFNRAVTLAEGPDKARLRVKMGETSLRLGQYPQAEWLFGQVTEDQAAEPAQAARGWQGLGLALMAQERNARAVEALQKAVEAEPGLWRAHSALGVAFNRLERPEEAARSFRRAIELRPRQAGLHNNLALALTAQGKIRQAEAALRRALSLQPDGRRAHNNLGLILARQGRWEEARRHFVQGAGESEALNNLGCLLSWRGEDGQAYQSFRRAIEARPRFYPLASHHLEQVRHAAPAQEPALVLDFSGFSPPAGANPAPPAPRSQAQEPAPRSQAQEPAPSPAAYPAGQAPAAGSARPDLAHAPAVEPPPEVKARLASAQLGQGVPIGAQGVFAEKDEAHLAEGLRVLPDAPGRRLQGHPGGVLQGIAVGAGGDAGEGHGGQPVFGGQAEGAFIGRGQEPLVFGAAPVDRPHGVDYLLGRELSGGGDDRLAGGAMPDLPALGHDLRPAGAVDGAVHPAPALELAVGRVDHGVNLLAGDVSLHQGQPGAADGGLIHGFASPLAARGQEVEPAGVLHATGQLPGRGAAAEEKVQPARAADGAAGVLVEYQAHQGSDPAVWRGRLSLDVAGR